MSADIANVNGRDLFATHREPAWHRLGKVFLKAITHFGAMLREAGLADWNVRLVDASEWYPGRFVAKTYFVVATIEGADIVLGTVNSRYTIVQNEQAFAMLQSLADGKPWESAGALKGGRLVFGSLEWERETTLDPNGVADRIRYYLLVTNSFDGSTNLTGGRTATRVVCANTLNVAMRDLDWQFTVRHTKSAEERMRQLAEEWRQTHAYFDAVDAEAQTLFATKCTDKQYNGLVTQMIGERPDTNKKGEQTKYDNNLGLFTQAWKGEPNAGIRGTAWGAFNALTERIQWGRNVQDTDNGQENFYAAGGIWDGATNKARQSAYALARTLVKA